MDIHSQKTLREIEQNGSTLTKLLLGDGIQMAGRSFYSSNSDDYARLCTSIQRNTHLSELAVILNHISLHATDQIFFDGLRHNTSITCLELLCGHYGDLGNINGRAGHQILRAYQENNTHLTSIRIEQADLRNGGVRVITTTLRNSITLTLNNINVEQLILVVEAIREHTSLENLDLIGNAIGNAGCEILVTLIEDPTCNLRKLELEDNGIGNEGAIIFANSIQNNTKLKELDLCNNPINTNDVQGVFSGVLCNKSSINDTYSSNHTLERLYLPQVYSGNVQVRPLLKLNTGTNKSHVAIKKIIKYHPNINMEPLFKWNLEGEGERDLKALPYVLAWFERAVEAVADDEEGEAYNIGEQKLSAMYQFAKALPLLFVPASHTNKDSNNKRKRNK